MFNISAATMIDTEHLHNLSSTVIYASQMLARDIAHVCKPLKGGEIGLYCRILLLDEEGMEPESYRIEVTSDLMTLKGGDDLGFMYGIIYISRTFLGVLPFWFWMDQKFTMVRGIAVEEQVIESVKPVVRYRGWFINDEVLLMKWAYNSDGVSGWQMAFEALLRCGGNMVIPGTDKMAIKNRKLASDMGLIITHHHAEPLGAEMFIRRFPELTPNYYEHEAEFLKLWEEAVIAQKDMKVIWNLCFRGQGDMPFWASDTEGRYDTDAKRGALISKVLKIQSDIVKKYVKNPVFCVNLYGEVMELYKGGYITLPDDTIRVRADNGYGRMVTRRRGNEDFRIDSCPERIEREKQGIYYHVSFYDLQAANHITSLPNSVDMVSKELTKVLRNRGDAFWVINCSNIRPHVYMLDAVRKKWLGLEVSDESHSREFAADYFDGDEKVAESYRSYPDKMISFGPNEDQHMGEQFYTENARIIAYHLIRGESEEAKELRWIAKGQDIYEQTACLRKLVRPGVDELLELCEKCADFEGLAGATIKLAAFIHYYGALGFVTFAKGVSSIRKGEYKKAFVRLGNAAEVYEEADKMMRASEYGVWKDFYYNECFADFKHTAYMIRKLMGVVRELGDSVAHDRWYRESCYAPEDVNVYLLMVTDNHMTDEELYQKLKNSDI